MSYSPPSSPPTRLPRATTKTQLARRAGSLDHAALEAAARKPQQYAIGDEMDSGAFGRVYRAKDRAAAGRDVVMKQVSISDNSIWYVEVILGRELVHAGVSRMLDMFIQDKEVFMVYEYAPDMDLVDWIHAFYRDDARSEIPAMIEEITRHIAWQLVSAIRYCHGKGVAHRDIKPDNIRISQDTLDVVLIDFGLGYVAEKASDRMLRCGSALYAAPELLRGGRYEIDPFASDIWALGVVLFGVAHGELPYVTDEKTLKTSDWIRVDPDFSVEMAAFLGSTFDPNPRKRARIEHLADDPWLRISRENQNHNFDRRQHLQDTLRREWASAIDAMTRCHQHRRSLIDIQEVNEDENTP